MESKEATFGCGGCRMRSLCGQPDGACDQAARPNARALVLAYVVPLCLLLAGVVGVHALGSRGLWPVAAGLALVGLWFGFAVKRIKI